MLSSDHWVTNTSFLFYPTHVYVYIFGIVKYCIHTDRPDSLAQLDFGQDIR